MEALRIWQAAQQPRPGLLLAPRKKLGTLCWSANQGQTGRAPRDPRPPVVVESRCGAVALGCTYLFPPLSSGGALVV